MSEWLTSEERIEIACIINKLSQLGISYTKNIAKVYYHTFSKEGIADMKSDLQKMRNIHEIYNAPFNGIYGWALTKNGRRLIANQEDTVTWVDISAWLPEYDYRIVKLLPFQDTSFPKKEQHYLEDKDYWKLMEWEAYNFGRIQQYEYLTKNGIKLQSREIWEYTKYITYEDSILNDIDEDGNTDTLNRILDRYPRGYGSEGDAYRDEDEYSNDKSLRLNDSIYQAIESPI